METWLPLGTSGLRVSRLALGTATFGVAPRSDEVEHLLCTALDAGINMVDSSGSYGDQSRFDRPGAPPATHRESAESLIGRTLGSRRHEVVLCTKVGERIFGDLNGHGLGRKHIRRAVERSLQRLRTDYIDILYAHHPDPATGIDELLMTFADLVRNGSILHYGISTFSGWQTAEVVLRADALGVPRPAIHQIKYNARERRAEDEVAPACRHFGLPIAAFGPLAGGLLAAGTSDRVALGSARWQGPGPSVDDRRFADDFRLLAAEHGLDPAVLALGWVLSRDGVISSVVGPESSEELVGLLPAATTTVPVEALDAVTAMSCPPIPQPRRSEPGVP